MFGIMVVPQLGLKLDIGMESFRATARLSAKVMGLCLGLQLVLTDITANATFSTKCSLNLSTHPSPSYSLC